MHNISENTLSVLLPNYNNASFLRESLDSLFNQTHQDFLIYFVDDGSVDESVAIAKSYNDERLIIIEKKSNSGIVDTLNIGLEQIKTKFFIRMDGDDRAAPDRFEKMMGFMVSNPSVDICGSDIQNFGIRDNYIRYKTDPKKIKTLLIFGHGVGHATAIFKTKVLKDNGIKYLDDFNRLEDYYLFYRLRDYAVSVNINEPLYYYRQEEFNNNVKLKQMLKLEYLKIYKIILNEFFTKVTERDIELHLGLSLKGDLNYDFKEYKNYSDRLIKANSDKNVYPEFEFLTLINDHLDRLKYRQIDNKKVSFVHTVKDAFKGDLKFVKYYVSTRVFKRK